MERMHLHPLGLIAILVWVGLLSSCGNYEERKQAYFERAVELFEADDLARAQLELKNVLQIDSKYAPGWYWLGRINERESDYRRAFAHYSRALELDPELVDARIRRGQLYLLGDKSELAGEDAAEALKREPESADALMLRASVRKRDGDIDGARDDARAALALEPGHAAALALIATALFDDGDRQAAVAKLEEAIAAHPEMPELPLLLGGFLDQMGDVQGAVEALKALVASHPDVNEYRRRLSTYLLQQGREAEAEQELRDALGQAPGDFDRQAALIGLVSKLHGRQQALAELQALRQAHPQEIRLQFAEAELLKALNRNADAGQVYRQVIAARQGQGPDAVRARNALAGLLLDTDREAAKALIAETLAESPNEPDALQLRSTISMLAKDYDQAIIDLRTLLKAFPERLLALRTLGQAHAAKGESALAEDAFKKAIRTAPDNPTAYLQLAELRVRGGDDDGALLTLEALLEKAPDNEAAQRAIARIQLSKRDWQALSETAERIRKTRPDHPLGYYLQGLLLQREGEHGSAIESFEQALATAPGSIEPAIALARSQLALKRFDAAEQRVRTILQDHPNNVVALNLLGYALGLSGEVAKAREVFGEAITFHPKSPQAYQMLAQLEQQAQGPEAAIAVLRRGVAATGRNAYLLLHLAEVLEQTGDNAGAVARYEEILQQFPNADVVANNLAVALTRGGQESGDLDRALKLVERFTESEVPEFLDTLGWIRYQRGEYQAALPPLRKAVAKNAEIGDIQFHLAMSYAKTGDRQKARDHLERAAASENLTETEAVRSALQALD